MVVKSIYIWGLLINVDDTLKDGQYSHLQLVVLFNIDVLAKLIFLSFSRIVVLYNFTKTSKSFTLQVAHC